MGKRNDEKIQTHERLARLEENVAWLMKLTIANLTATLSMLVGFIAGLIH